MAVRRPRTRYDLGFVDELADRLRQAGFHRAAGRLLLRRDFRAAMLANGMQGLIDE